VQPAFLDTPLFTSKTDIIGMHLLGAAAFFATAPRTSIAPWLRKLTPLVIGTAVVYIGIGQNRATFLALIGMLALLAFYRIWRPILLTVALAVGFMVLLASTNLQLQAGAKSADFGTIVQRELSVLDFSNDSSAQTDLNDPNALSNVGTISWRLIWWHALWDDAMSNPRVLLFGRGYGYDLRNTVAPYAPPGVVYVFAQDEDHPLRSPHNITMTLLARSGVVGLMLWVLLLSACFLRLFRATLLCRRARDTDQELLGVWFITELAVIVMVALFGVVLESPHAAIPFFLVLGAALGWATERVQRKSAYVRSAVRYASPALAATRPG
jgi:O-antigen ligase